jgi:outer membrane receptor for ferrienterochelin and colicins
MKKISITLLLNLFYSLLFSQGTGSVSGKITDKETNEVLPGATIALKGTTVIVTAKKDGSFRIDKVLPGDYFLSISYVGYETMEVPVTVSEGDSLMVNVGLPQDTRMGNGVVVSASKRAEKLTHAPASIRVIGKKELDEFAASNVFELASYQQGIEFVRSGIDYITLNARGFNRAINNRVLQIVDYRNSMTTASTYLPMYNFSTINKLDVDRIEIILGPQSALYGPNAHNAVLNVITKDPKRYQGTTVAVSAGNHYQFSTRLRHAVKINNRWAYKIVGEYLSGREFIFYDSVYAGNQTGLTPQFGPPVTIPERNVDFDFRRMRGEAHLYYVIRSKTEIVISGGKSDNHSLGMSNLGRNQVRGINVSFLQARLVHPHFFATVYNTWGRLGEGHSIYGYTRDFWNRTHTTPPMAEDSAETAALRGNRSYEKNQRLNAEAQYNHFFQKAGLHLVTGLSYQKEKPNSSGTTLVDAAKRIYVTQWGGVVQLEKSLPHGIRFIGAARLDNHTNYGTLFSPKLALTKSINDNSIRVTWARAYAAPGIFFQYASGPFAYGNGPGVKYIPNGSIVNEQSVVTTVPLKPEEINTWEIGYKGTLSKKVYVDLNAYYGNSKNFLSPPLPVDGRAVAVGDEPVTPTNPGTVDGNGRVQGARFSSYFNFGNVRTYGLDIGLTYTLSKIANLSLRYSWFDSGIKDNNLKNDANKDGFVTTEERSLNAPNHRGVAIVNFKNLCKQKVFANISARFTQQYDFYTGNQVSTSAGEGRRGIVYRGSLPAEIKNFDHGPLGGYAIIDIGAGYKISEMIGLNMNITNLFNAKQREFVGSPYIQRLIVFELKLYVPHKKQKL